MRLFRISLIAFLAAASCGGGPAARSQFEPCEPKRIVRDGDQIPDCTFEKMDGGSIALRELQGKPVVMNFWASWCLACENEMPAIERIWKDLGPDLQIVGMNALAVDGESREDARGFLREAGVTYANAFDPGGLLYANFFGSTRSRRYPLTLFIDAQGIVRKTSFGELTEGEIRKHVRQVLGV